MHRRIVLSCLVALACIFAADTGQAFAQYVHFDGPSIRKLVVGRGVYIGNQFGPTVVFQKDGHLFSTYSHKVVGNYSIAEDGKICFDGGIHFSVSGSRKAETCFRIVKSNDSYLGVDPDTFFQWVFVRFPRT